MMALEQLSRENVHRRGALLCSRVCMEDKDVIWLLT